LLRFRTNCKNRQKFFDEACATIYASHLYQLDAKIQTPNFRPRFRPIVAFSRTQAGQCSFNFLIAQRKKKQVFHFRPCQQNKFTFFKDNSATHLNLAYNKVRQIYFQFFTLCSFRTDPCDETLASLFWHVTFATIWKLLFWWIIFQNLGEQHVLSNNGNNYCHAPTWTSWQATSYTVTVHSVYATGLDNTTFACHPCQHALD